jgi:uncharacterized RDD family membrane protein YckC
MRHEAPTRMNRQAETPGEPATDAAVPPRDGYAGIVSRVAALVLDVVVVTLVAAVVTGLALAGAEVMLGRVPAWVQVPTAIAVSLLPVTYFTVAWWLIGQTLGAVAMGIEVRDAAGRPLRFPRAFIRAAVGLLLAPVWIVGMILILLDDRRRGLLDIAVGTTVIYRPESPAV